MMGMPRPLGKDPRRYTSPIRLKLGELANQMRDDAKKVEDEDAKTLLETGAGTLIGLMKAFEDYESRDESAWR